MHTACRNLLWGLLASSLLLVRAVPARAIELAILNDLRDGEEGSELEIENAISRETPKTKINFKMMPKEKKDITEGNVTSFVLARVFPDHKLKYHVNCDPD